MNTKNYYNEQAVEFIENTFNVDMSNIYEAFLEYVPQGGKILDIGCGSGRDALYFKNSGFITDAFDYSESLVGLAKEKTGLDIQCKSFYELDTVNEYDGIWACASLLHCERSRLIEVMKKIIAALKTNGICYVSFKYGNQDRTKDGRSFTDLNEEQANEILTHIGNVQLLEQWVTTDNRPDRQESWLNIIFKKNLRMKWLENDLRDQLFDNHKSSLHELISGLKPLVDQKEEIYDFSISKLLQKITENKIYYLVNDLVTLTLIGKEVRLKQLNRSITRIDLLGISEASTLHIIELKTSKKTEREAFTELLGYANHYSLLFPGLKESALNSILISPMESRITQDAFLQESLINHKPILALRPIHDEESGIKLQVYYPDASIYEYFENNMLNDQSMITVVLTFNEIKGWIDTDINNEGTIPEYSRDALNRISIMISQKLEAEGLHSLVYASQQWGEIAKIFPFPNKITVAAINPFASFRTDIHEGQIYGDSNEHRISAIQSIYDQLTEEGKDDWLSYMENGFHDRLIGIVKDTFEESIGSYQRDLKEKVRYEISIPDWYGLKKSMIESVFVYNLDIFCTGLLREIVSEYIKLMYQDGSEDMSKFPYGSINNWLLVWTILERIGSYDAEEF